MNDLNEKIKLIFLPYLVVNFGFVAFYELLDWVLVTYPKLLIHEQALRLWLPILLLTLLVATRLRPRIHLLHFRYIKDAHSLQGTLVITIFLQTMIAHDQLKTVISRTTHLDNIAQIHQHPTTKYYTFEHCFIDTTKIEVYENKRITGKFGNDLVFETYVVLPIFSSKADTAQMECEYWLGQKYDETISSKLDDSTQNTKYKIFAASVANQVRTTNFEQFTYLERLDDTNERTAFDKALQQSTLVRHQDAEIFQFRITDFGTVDAEEFLWRWFGLLSPPLLFLAFLFFKPFDPWNIEQFRQGMKYEGSSLRDLFE